ncbi:MSHA biogenesis protein MshC [Shewanella sp. UCD-FRSSP16_17]|uniref:type II secretion system protein n=1 Tax=unclassified Shewanella TaxID=196818 RepID=UPI0007EEF240|nr:MULTISPECIES: prepilin-type N-terminal cleavage/methylation domain-containing protein [unclassified Shewanella]MBQ4890828.1 prepilin-type N-terminal cleavage/methylation domain-containing protein [Shewanella sp. MMG014]OBT06707.1 MSHA biogenesis protein MshC [Shewanella sp. UCD-FRSSP16_17]
MQHNQSKRYASGFSLIELVTTILIVGILAVFVIPKLIPESSYSAYTLRNEFISELRQVQIKALNNSDRCYRITVDSDGYQLTTYSHNINASFAGCVPAQLIRTDLKQTFNGGAYIELASNSSTSFSMDFDNLGRSTLACTGSCFVVVADESLTIAMESEGYIHGL